MRDISFGAVVLTGFPFTDLSSARRRPALGVSTDNSRRTDVIVAYITPVLRNETDAAPHRKIRFASGASIAD